MWNANKKDNCTSNKINQDFDAQAKIRILEQQNKSLEEEIEMHKEKSRHLKDALAGIAAIDNQSTKPSQDNSKKEPVMAETASKNNNPHIENNNNNDQAKELSDVEKAAIGAVEEGNYKLLQVLLGKKHYMRTASLDKRQSILELKIQCKLHLINYEVFKTIIQRTVSLMRRALIVNHNELTSTCNFLSGLIENHFKFLEDGNGGNTDGIKAELDIMPSCKVSQEAKNNLKRIFIEEIKEQFKTHKQVINLTYIDPDKVISGKLAGFYKQRVELTYDILEKKTFVSMILAQINSANMTYSYALKCRDAFKKLEEEIKKLDKKYDEMVQQLIADNRNNALLTQHCQDFNGIALSQWYEQGGSPVSLELEDENKVSLLEKLCENDFNEKQVFANPPQHEKCVIYLTRAHIASNHYIGIQRPLLMLYNQQDGSIKAESELNSEAYQLIFDELYQWYQAEHLVTWEDQYDPSYIEKFAFEHSHQYTKGKRTNFQRFLDIFRREPELKNFIAQAERTKALTLFSHKTHGDESLVAMIYDLFKGKNAIDRFFHPHKKLYAVAEQYREQGSIEVIGFISVFRSDQAKKDQWLEDMAKEKEEMRKKDEAREKEFQALKEELAKYKQQESFKKTPVPAGSVLQPKLKSDKKLEEEKLLNESVGEVYSSPQNRLFK